MAALTEADLLAAAGEVIFDRGEAYVRYVVGLRVTEDSASASVQGQRVYVVDLRWSHSGVRGSCTCPHHEDGHFCKHLVAVGLAAIDAERDDGGGPSLEALVGELDTDELRNLVIGLAESDPEVRRALEIRRASRSGDTDAIAQELTTLAKDALSLRGFVDYRRSFEVAADAEALLDELETYLAGNPDAVRPALLKAVTRLLKITEQGDDSSGAMGSACQRAAELYARACREGSPDGKKLAAWLVKFRANSPGWPQLELADFVDAFDDRALAHYRREVDKLDRAQAGADRWARHEVDRMLLELADHDGDVDKAVELLSHDEHAAYGAIVQRLRAAGREDEAVAWIDRAVAAGRATGHAGAGHDFWLSPHEVARTYRAHGRADDAFEVLRADFERQPGLGTYRQLLDHAIEEDRWDSERRWALDRAAELAERPFVTGAPLVEIALGEGDLDAAWAAANAYGAGHQWQALAKASAEARPLDAASLYREGIEKDLTHSNSGIYPDVAKRLALMRDLHEQGGAPEVFAEYVAGLREKYKRRPALMAALGRREL